METTGQSIKYKLQTVGFYNVENLFDTIDDPITNDDDYTPEGKFRYSKQNYRDKIKNTALVISQMGSGRNDSGPVILGVAEIENGEVLRDLVRSDVLRSSKYQIIHQDSPDRRGIDVALMYKDDSFNPLEANFIEVRLWNEKGERIYTRDILHVHGIFEQEEIHVIVNHWPSRRGGKSRSDPKRMKAAYLVKQFTDGIFESNPEAKIIIMGDFNDDPKDKSIVLGLTQVSPVEKKADKFFFNPMLRMYEKGYNTLAYRDGLNLFDQILVSSNFLSKGTVQNGYRLYRAGVFNPSYLIQRHGKYSGYPLRSFENGRYSGGYSDHFPVYIDLIKPLSD